MTSYAIIGDGAVGTTAAFYIRRPDPDGRITIYSDEPTTAYRAALTITSWVNSPRSPPGRTRPARQGCCL